MAPSGAAVDVAGCTDLEARLSELLLKRAQAHRDDFSPVIQERLREHVHRVIQNWEQLVIDVQRGGSTLKYSPWERKATGQALLSTATDDLKGDYAELLDTFRAPTSMRDVEPTVHVWVDRFIREGRR